VIEIVGPRSIAGSAVKALLDPKWLDRLGKPAIFVMGPADSRWRTLAADDPTGSYDSLALAWDLLKHHGALRTESARHLLSVAHAYAEQVQRRALPLPVPDDVDAMREALEALREALDIGVDVAVAFPQGGVAEAELVAKLEARGLTSMGDSYAWSVPGWDEPLLYATACEDEPPFPSGDPMGRHTSLCLGFSIPRNPVPRKALDALLLLADDLTQEFHGVAFADGTPLVSTTMLALLDQALLAFQRANRQPGSPEARLLFQA